MRKAWALEGNDGADTSPACGRSSSANSAPCGSASMAAIDPGRGPIPNRCNARSALAFSAEPKTQISARTKFRIGDAAQATRERTFGLPYGAEPVTQPARGGPRNGRRQAQKRQAQKRQAQKRQAQKRQAQNQGRESAGSESAGPEICGPRNLQTQNLQAQNLQAQKPASPETCKPRNLQAQNLQANLVGSSAGVPRRRPTARPCLTPAIGRYFRASRRPCALATPRLSALR